MSAPDQFCRDLSGFLDFGVTEGLFLFVLGGL